MIGISTTRKRKLNCSPQPPEFGRFHPHLCPWAGIRHFQKRNLLMATSSCLWVLRTAIDNAYQLLIPISVDRILWWNPPTSSLWWDLADPLAEYFMDLYGIWQTSFPPTFALFLVARRKGTFTGPRNRRGVLPQDLKAVEARPEDLGARMRGGAGTAVGGTIWSMGISGS